MSEEDVIQNDLAKILVALGISDHARPKSCHRVVWDEVLPAISEQQKRIAELEREKADIETRVRRETIARLVQSDDLARFAAYDVIKIFGLANGKTADEALVEMCCEFPEPAAEKESA